MKLKFTPRTFLIVGFLISFTALILNAIILANVGNRLNTANAEYDNLTAAVRVQTDLGNEALSKFEDYTMMTHISAIVPEKRREEAMSNTAVLLDEALIFLYAAANDISMTEIRRVESEVDAETFNEVETRNKSETEQKEKEKSEKEKSSPQKKAETEKLVKAAVNVLEKREPNPAEIDVKTKLSAMSTIANVLVTAENPQDFFVLFLPVNKALNNRWLESVTAKRNRLAELETERRTLGQYQNYCTFSALALQMIGLGFVFIKDLAGQKSDEEEETEKN